MVLSAVMLAFIGAPPKLPSLFPAGARVGTEVVVTTAGSFDRWPVQGWMSGRGTSVTAAKEKGQWTVKIDPGAVPGVRWLRLFNEDGASSLRPFILGTLPEVLEQEPNDQLRAAQAVAIPAVVNGVLSRNGDVDGYAVALKRGQVLIAALEAYSTLRSPIDASLQIVSARGFVLAQNDDTHGFDPQLVFPVPADGTYIVRTFAFPATPNSTIGFTGGSDDVYRLTLTTGGFVDHAVPLAVTASKPTTVQLFGWNLPPAATRLTLAPGPEDETVTVYHPLLANTLEVPVQPLPVATEQEPNDRAHPQPLVLPVCLTGRIDPPGDIDGFSFVARKGERLTFRVESSALEYPLDPVLRLRDGSGKLLEEVDDSSRRRDPELRFTAPAAGSYRIEITDLYGAGGLRYVYRLTAGPPIADFSLAVALDRFALAPGKTLDLPVTIRRHEGFAQPIDIIATGLPGTVRAAAARSEAMGESAGTVQLRLTAGPEPVSGAFQVIGKSVGPDLRFHRATAPIEGFEATTPDLWLTVGTKAEAKPAPPVRKRR